MRLTNETLSVGLIVDDFLLQNAGIPRYCAQLYAGLRETGLDVHRVTTRGPRIPYGEAYNHTVRLTSHILRRTHRLDILHATCPITALSFPLVKRKRVVTYHDCFSILGRRDHVSVHGKLLLPLVYRMIAAHSDKVIAVSTQTKGELIEHLGVAEDKIAVVNSGVDERFRPLSKNRGKHCYTIGYVGTLLSSRKRLDYLVAAFGLLKDKHRSLPAKLVLCGDERGQAVGLRQLIETLGLCREVELTDFVSDEYLVETYNSFDVFVLPSDWEGFGFTILEAQRCGVPVVIREEARIPREVSLFCLKASSEEDMADKIYALLTNDKLRQSVVEEGLEYSQRFAWDRSVQQTITIYEELLSGR